MSPFKDERSQRWWNSGAYQAFLNDKQLRKYIFPLVLIGLIVAIAIMVFLSQEGY